MRKGKMPGRIGRGSSNSQVTEVGKTSDPFFGEVARPPRVVPPRKTTVREALAEMEARLDEMQNPAES